MSTLPLFDHPAIVRERRTEDLSPARSARDLALNQVESHAAPGFLEDALAVIRRVALRRETLTTDDVIPEMTVGTHDGRALGAAMVKAAKAGYIVATDRFVNTNRVSRHHAPIRVWRSLVWGRS